MDTRATPAGADPGTLAPKTDRPQESTASAIALSPPDDSPLRSAPHTLRLAQQALRHLILESRDATLSDILPCCGFIPPGRFQTIFHTLAQAFHQDLLPKTIIGVGSGDGFLEKCFATIGCQVSCYDRKPCNKYLPVKAAEFPEDISRCLPEDCSDAILLAGYPQGYLGPILAEFISRGGKMLCTTVERSLFSSMHEGYETTPSVLRQALRTLKETKTGEFFDIELRPRTMLFPPACIQFYNFPSSVRQLLLDSPRLKDACRDIRRDI